MKPYRLILGTVLLFLSIPILVYVLQSPQTIRQRAQTMTAPQCTAEKGTCVSTADGCFLEETNVGKKDCSTGQTCCAVIIPPQCFAKKGVCVPSSSGCLAIETNVGQLDCASGRVCCAVNVPPQCKAKNGACFLKTNNCFDGETDVGQLDCNSDQKCCATIPTPSAGSGQAPTAKPTTAPTAVPTVKPTTAVPTPSTAPTVVPTFSTSEPQPTIAQGGQPNPTFAASAGNTTIAFIMALHGIGTAGDNVSAGNTMSNKTPVRTLRTFTVQVRNTAGSYIRDFSTPFAYDSQSGTFLGKIELPDVTTGPHTIKLKTPGYIEKTVSDTIPAGAGGFYEVTLTAGDINGDNKLDALDYNAIVGCYNLPASSDTCSLTDVNDDGLNNGVDYNLFLREIVGNR